MRALKKKNAINRTIFCSKYFVVTLFFTLISPSFVLAQSSIIDEVWQKWIDGDDPNKIEHFLYEVQGIKGHLDINDITYGINLAFSSPYNHNRPKELMVWHQIAGDIYKDLANTQSNTLFHYQHALKLAEKLNNLPEKIGTMLRIAELYRVVGFPELAYSHAISAEKLCQDPRNLDKLPHASDYLYQIADHYIRVNKRERANNCYRLAVERNRFGSAYSKIYTFNNWGVNNIAQERYRTALHLFDQGIAVAKEHKLVVWVGIMTGNQGWVYFKMNQWERAKALISYELKIGAKLDSNSAARSAQLLAQIALKQGNPAHAFEMLKYSETLAPSIATTPSNIHLWSTAYAQTKNWEEAYRSALLADQEEEKRAVQKVEQEKRLYNNMTHFLDQEHELRQQAKQLVFEKKQTRNRLLFLILVFSLSVGIGAVFLLRAKQLSLKHETQLHLELQDLKKQVEHYQHVLLQQAPDPNVEAESVRLQRTLEINQQLQRTKLLTDQEWRTFKLSFEQIYPAFLQKISTHAAQFSPAEVRLLTLSKLGLKGPEIAEILGISMDGVKKGKQRLKKKLQMYPEELELIDLIS